MTVTSGDAHEHHDHQTHRRRRRPLNERCHHERCRIPIRLAGAASHVSDRVRAQSGRASLGVIRRPATRKLRDSNANYSAFL